MHLKYSAVNSTQNVSLFLVVQRISAKFDSEIKNKFLITNQLQNLQLESSEDSSFCFSEYKLICIVKENFWETTTFTDFRRI